jgi:hypothetical protein
MVPFEGSRFMLLAVLLGWGLSGKGLALPSSDVGWDSMDSMDTSSEAPSPSPSARKVTAHRLLTNYGPSFGAVYAQRKIHKEQREKRKQLRHKPKFSRQADTDDMMDRLLHIRRHHAAQDGHNFDVL